MSSTPPKPAVVLLAANGPATQALSLLIEDWDFVPLVTPNLQSLTSLLNSLPKNVIAVITDSEFADSGTEALEAVSVLEAEVDPVSKILMTKSFDAQIHSAGGTLYDAVLAKPFDPETLHQTLTDALCRQDHSRT